MSGLVGQASGADRAQLASELADEVMAAVQGDYLAVVLYGSRARGTARPDSDIDVLQIVERRPRTYAVGKVNVSAYHVETLRTMARRGSLFILHLKTDGIPVKDDEGVFMDLLWRYVEPKSYAPLLAEIRAAGTALLPALDSEKYRMALRRLGIYLVRTAAYARLAASGTPIFDLKEAGRAIGDARVADALALKDESPASDDFGTLSKALRALVGEVPENTYGSIEALAVARAATHPYAASLLTQVIAGAPSGIEYTALTPPPL